MAPAILVRTASVVLAMTDSPWPYAAANRQAISAHWRRRSAENPAFFDGQVIVVREVRLAPDAVRGTASLERFSAFLHWRDLAPADEPTLDGFGSALVRSAEGHVMLGRMAAHTMNPGLVYLPGGFLDARDIRADGTVDIERAIARELREETGLEAAALSREPGFLVARHGRHCCFAIEYRAALPATELLGAMRGGLARDGERELADIVAARDRQDLARLGVMAHARFLIEQVLAATP